MKITKIENCEKLVILFGWSGSNEKNLSKYKELYQKDFNTIQLTQEIFFLKFKDETNTIIELLNTIEEEFNVKNNENFEIFIHVFSNGGLIRYSKFVDVIKTNKYSYFQKNFKKTIFDSCPGNLTSRSAATATTSYIKNYFYRKICYFIMYWLTSFLKIFYILRIFQSPDQFTRKLIYDESLNGVPFLFLYSDSDDLIEYQYVEYYMDMMKMKNKTVSSFKFEGSMHVAHLLKHKEKYIELIKDFIKF
jgi:hypothetical protein